MKVGYFSHSSISASETFILDLILGLKSSGLNITFYSGQSKVNPLDGVKTIPTGYELKNTWIISFIYLFGQIFGKRGQRLVYRYKEFYTLKVLKSIIGSNLPNVAYVDYGTSAVLLRKYFKLYSIPYIVHFHGYDITSFLNDNVYKHKLKSVFKEATFIIAASHHIKRLLILNGCDPAKINVVRLGINTSSIIPLSWTERIKSNPKIIFLGRLTTKKNPIALLYSFKIVSEKISDATLTIIGDGPLRQEVISCIEALKLTNKVTLLGSVPRSISFPILNEHWIYVQHSVTASDGDQEGFALSLAEAAAHEIPVVSTFHNGIPENVVDGVTGYLVREFDYETMAEKIIELIENPEKAKAMGINGRSHITHLCSIHDRVESIKVLLEAASVA